MAIICSQWFKRNSTLQHHDHDLLELRQRGWFWCCRGRVEFSVVTSFVIVTGMSRERR